MNNATIQRIATVLYDLRWPLMVLVLLVVIGLIWLCVSMLRERKQEGRRLTVDRQKDTTLRRQLKLRLEQLATDFTAQASRVRERLRTYQSLCGQDFNIKDISALDQGMLPRILRKELGQYQPLLPTGEAGRLLGLFTYLATESERRRGKLRQFVTDFSPHYEEVLQGFFQHVAFLGQLHDQLGTLAVKELDNDLRIWANAYLGIFEEWRLAGADRSVAGVKEQLVEPIHALGSLTKSNPFVDQTERIAKEGLSLVRRLEIEDARAETTLRIYASGQAHAARFCHLLALGLTAGQEARPQDAKQGIKAKNLARIPMLAPAAAPLATSQKEQKPSSWLQAPDWWQKTRRQPKRWLPWVLPLILLPLAGGMWSQWPEKPAPEPHYHTGHALPPAPEHDDYDSIEEHQAHLVDQSRNLQDTTTADTLFPLVPLQPIHPKLVPEYGIDISHYQGVIDWTLLHNDTLPSPLRFVIMKASQGKRIDPRFHHNWGRVDTTVSHRGAYHFFSFRVDPREQARFYIENVPLQAGNFRPILDVEAYGSPDPLSTGPLTPEKLRERVRTWISLVEAHFGTKVIIYSGNYYYKKHLKGHFPDNDFWLAQYSKSAQAKAMMEAIITGDEIENAIMWQFSSTGNVAGITGDVDLNFLPARYLDRVLID